MRIRKSRASTVGRLSWGLVALMVRALDSESSTGRGHCAVFSSHSTLTVPLSTQEYKWALNVLTTLK